MKFLDWIKDFFGVDQSEAYVNQQAIASTEVQLAIEDFAICTAINLIAGAVSKCEFKTHLKNKNVKGDEYYLWNIEPNKNQNSSQFLQELVSKLIYYNEALVIEVNGQLIIADDFYQNEYAVVENTFVNISRGTMQFSRPFKMSEVLYFKYSNNEIKRLLSNLMKGYNNLLNMSIGKYKRSGGRKGVVKINQSAKGDKDFQEKMDDLFKNKFKSYFESENAVLLLQNGVDYDEKNGEGNKKSTSEIVDISSITKEAFERVAQALKIPPAVLRGDIADVEKATDNLLTFGIDPLCCLIQEEINRKRYGKAVLTGSYLRIDTTCIKHIDVFAVSEKVDKLIASGTYSIDELRTKLGDTTLDVDWSVKHFMTKNYADINNLEGGDTGGTNLGN